MGKLCYLGNLANVWRFHRVLMPALVEALWIYLSHLTLSCFRYLWLKRNLTLALATPRHSPLEWKVVTRICPA